MPRSVSSNNKNLEAFIYNKLVPDEKVRKVFNRLFPEANDVEWTYKSNNIYEAVFSHLGYYKNVCISTGGEIKELKIMLEEDDLPETIINKLDKKFNRTYIISCMKVEHRNNESYEIIFDTEDKTRYLVLFDHKGKVIRKDSLFVVKSDLME